MKPWVKVSTCPVGKYRDTSRYPSRDGMLSLPFIRTRKVGWEKVLWIKFIR